MKRGITAIAAAIVLMTAQSASAGGTATLYPSSFGAFTTASWRAQIGLPDTVGSADQALVLKKETKDPGTAAMAIVRGIEGESARLLTGLEWQREIHSDCTKTSPRWTLVVQGKSGRRYLVRFGCAQSLHAATPNPNWLREFNNQPLIRSRLVAAGKSDALNGTIVSLAIVFDDRALMGATILDNIRVIVKSAFGAQTWTCAADNAAVVPGPPAADFAPDDLGVNPLSDAELMTFDELWPTLAPEDQALVVDTSDSAAG